MPQTLSAREVVPVFDPSRLKLAREARGLKQNELALRLGVQPAAVSQYEHGRSRPSAPTLTAIGLALHFPVSFFARVEGRRAPHSFFRSLRSTTVTDRKQAEATTELLFELAMALERHVHLPVLDLPNMPLTNGASPEDMAAKIRDHWGIQAGPIRNMVRLLEQRGVIVARTLRGSDDVDAFSRPFHSRPVVVLAADKKDRARSRFDAAHELGHLIMHREDAGIVKQVESEAHAFASELLMPADEIRNQLPVRLDWDRLVKLKFRWGVSIKALLMRARSLAVMPESTYVRAMKLYSSKGWSKGEPGDLGPPETPRLLQKAAEVVYGSGVTSTQLADEAKLTVSEVDRLLGEAGDIRPQLELGDEMFGATVVDATSRLNPGG